jgi:hypothetical protein
VSSKAGYFFHLYIIYKDYNINGNEFISPYSNVATETFDSTTLKWTWVPADGGVNFVNGSVSGQYAAPFGVSEADATKYVTVPKDSSPGSVTVNLGGGSYNYLGIWWGSVDDYNTISFLKNGIVRESFTGSNTTSTPNGNQGAHSTNLYVNFLNLKEFDSFRMTSNGYAFEADNISVGHAPVPIPPALLLMGSGLLGLAGFKKRLTN